MGIPRYVMTGAQQQQQQQHAGTTAKEHEVWMSSDPLFLSFENDESKFPDA